MPYLRNIPAVLIERDQWVVFKFATRQGKITKVPAHADGSPILKGELHAAWGGSYDQVLKTLATGRFDGVGFVILDEDPFCVADMDHCRNRETGELIPWAAVIVNDLGSLTEITPSKEGVRVWIVGQLPDFAKNRKPMDDNGGQVELYDHSRFVTVTGDLLPGAPKAINGRHGELEALCARLWPPTSANGANGASGARGAYDPSPPMSDVEVLDLARKATNGDKVKRLLDGDTSGYGSLSEADPALISLLAFYTQDTEQLDRLYRGSKLYREKWDRADYRERTLSFVLDNLTETYQPGGMGRHAEPAEARENPHLTDAGNASRLVLAAGDRMRWVKGWGWLAYDGKRWAPGEEIAQGIALEVALSIYEEAKNALAAQKTGELASWAKRSEQRAGIANMLAMAQFMAPIYANVENFDADLLLLNCPNGTVDLRTGQLHEHRPEDMLTKLAGAAYKLGAQSPLWDRTLADATAGKEGLSEFLQRAAGYSATGDVSEDAIFIPHGRGGTGKNTTIGAIQAALGDYARSADVSTLTEKSSPGGHSEDLAVLAGSRMVVMSEAEEQDRFRVGRLKWLSGGERAIPVSRKGLPTFTFTPTFHIWMHTNHVPRVRSDDSGAWRRIYKLPFENVPKRVDRTIRVRLHGGRANREAVLAWVVAGALAWQREGLNPPPCVTEATDELRKSMDRLAEFFDERCELDPGIWTSSANLQREYQDWARKEGIPDRYWASKNTLAGALRERGCLSEQKRTSTGVLWGWVGIRIHL
jgi:putative DNA primase/helicase